MAIYGSSKPTGMFGTGKGSSLFGSGRKLGAGGLTDKGNERPKYDQGRMAGLIQEQMEPQLGELRRQMQTGRSRRYSSPTARSEAMRGIYRGAGEAMPGIQAGAARTATGLYQPEYQSDVAAWEREQQDLANEEALAQEMAIRRSTPMGGETYRSAYDRMNAYDPFGASTRFDARPFTPTQQNVSYGATPSQRAAIESQGLQELANLYSSSTAGGYDPSRGYGG